MKPTFEAAFGETGIGPPPGTRKIGWLKELHGQREVDPPLMARLAVFRHGETVGAFLQLDLLSIRWSWVELLREAITRQTGFNGRALMVAATHNHAGPAVANAGDVVRDDTYTALLLDRCVALFTETLSRMQPAVTGFGHTNVWDVAHNRRVVMRDGTVRTHGHFNDPEALYLEGPVDPELAVLAVRSQNDHNLLGCVVNFSCHPTHHGGDDTFTAGYPGCLAADLRQRGIPVAVYLNGACGNLAVNDPTNGGATIDMQTAGKRLADAAYQVIESMAFTGHPSLRVRSRTIALPYRHASGAEQKGAIRGAQRFIDPAIYDRHIPPLMQRIKERGEQPAEVQVLQLDNLSWVAIPAEYFVEHQLRIKTATYPHHTLVVSHANGMVGYVPTKAAFEHGGYETTFAPTSRLAPDAGDRLADTAIALVNDAAG